MRWLIAIVFFSTLFGISCGGAACMAPEPASHCEANSDCPTPYVCDPVRKYCYRLPDAGLLTPETQVDASVIDTFWADAVAADTAQADTFELDVGHDDVLQPDAFQPDTFALDSVQADAAFDGMIADVAEPDSASEDAGNRCPAGFDPLGDGGWCARVVPAAATTPSGGSCGGEVMCIIDLENNDTGAAGFDGKNETFCVWAHGLAQTTWPVNGHTPLPELPDAQFPSFFGDIYAANPGLAYRLATAPISLDFRPMRLLDGYLCLSFAGALNSANYILVPISSYSRYASLTAGNSQCLELLVNGSDRRGLCPVDTGNANDFVRFRADEVCAAAAGGSLTENVCELHDAQWAFGFYYDATGLRAR
jgi:hypothetical protein